MDDSAILDIYYKIYTTPCNNDVVEKYIIFDSETESPFIYSTDKRVPAKLYIEPAYGQLRVDTIKDYTTKNGYRLALSLCKDSDENHEHRIINQNVICNKLKFKDHMNHVCKKFNDYAYDDYDTIVMCVKLQTCVKIYK